MQNDSKDAQNDKWKDTWYMTYDYRENQNIKSAKAHKHDATELQRQNHHKEIKKAKTLKMITKKTKTTKNSLKMITKIQRKTNTRVFKTTQNHFRETNKI